MSNTVAVIDYGMGNLHSIAKALEHACQSGKQPASVEVTSDPKRILNASHVVFPGVGGIRDCMAELQRLEMIEVVKQAAAERPFLGICLGMQAMLGHSEENGGVDGLNLIPGEVRYFGDPLTDPHSGLALKVPHMGWNQVAHNDHPVWQGIEDQTRFYFVHSYYADPQQEEHRAATAVYGHEFAAAVARDNMVGVQFHPEKSQKAGLTLLGNFLAWSP